jgi:mRNA-degrading endonuclease RelE of RelBE toxin-antitoxin system
MDVIIEPEAEEDLKDVEPGHRSYVKRKLQELSDDPTGNDKSGLIRIGGRQVFKFVMKEGSKGGKDYRAVYDVIGDEVRVIAIFHRDRGYEKEEISERF